MKKLILIILSLIFITGCYNYTEINNIKLVNGIYIDYKNDKYIFRFDINNENIYSTASSISEGFRNFESKISKRAYYAHLKILILSNEVLKNHFNEVTEFFLRNNEIRNNFYLVVSDNLKEIKSNYIKSLIINSNDVVSSPLFKKIVTAYLSNKEIIIPVIDDKSIIGSVIKRKNSIKKLNIDDSRLYKIIKNKHPNIVYKNLNIYHSKVKKINDTLYIFLDAELKENINIKVKKDLKKDLEILLNKKLVLNIDINRNGQILNE